MMLLFNSLRMKCTSSLDPISTEALPQFYGASVKLKVCAVAVAEGVPIAHPFLWVYELTTDDDNGDRQITAFERST